MKLTAKQEAFCLAYLQCRNASEAYRRSYGAEKMTEKSINETACRLLKNVKVAARLSAEAKVVLEAAHLTIESHLDELDRIKRMALSAEKYSAAVTAEMARGKVRGFYVDKVEATVNVMGMADAMRRRKGG